MERLHDAALQNGPSISFPSDAPLIPVQVDEQADVDISDDTFDFVRSIRVYHTQPNGRTTPSRQP